MYGWDILCGISKVPKGLILSLNQYAVSGELGPMENSAPGELGPISQRIRPHQPENSAPCSRRTRPLGWRTRPHSVAVWHGLTLLCVWKWMQWCNVLMLLSHVDQTSTLSGISVGAEFSAVGAEFSGVVWGRVLRGAEFSAGPTSPWGRVLA